MSNSVTIAQSLSRKYRETDFSQILPVLLTAKAKALAETMLVEAGVSMTNKSILESARGWFLIAMAEAVEFKNLEQEREAIAQSHVASTIADMLNTATMAFDVAKSMQADIDRIEAENSPIEPVEIVELIVEPSNEQVSDRQLLREAVQAASPTPETGGVFVKIPGKRRPRGMGRQS
jgi:hypothetical protein